MIFHFFSGRFLKFLKNKMGKKDVFFFIPAFTLSIFLVPIIVSFTFILIASLGISGAVVTGPSESGKIPLWAFFDRVGVWHSIGFTLLIALSATSIAWGLNCLLLGFGRQHRLFQICQKFLSPILAIPHITLAIGLLFLVAPAGIIARILAVILGWQSPPIWASNPDPYGVLLVLGLVMKELPFLFLLSLSALERINLDKHLLAGKSLGYSEAMAFFKLIYPIFYSQMRLPVFVVLAFSLAIIDMALVLAPHAPPVLGVKILQWARAPDLSQQYFAAAGAFWMMVLTLGVIGIWFGLGKLMLYPYHAFIINGWRGKNYRLPIGKYFTLSLSSLIIFVSMGAIFMLVIISVSGLWPFPDLLPPKLSLRYWIRAFHAMQTTVTLTLIIALLATMLSMVLAIGCLEAEQRYGFKPQKFAIMVLYLPLLIPQISFLFGVQILLLRLHLDGTLGVVIFGHMIFILPYAYLSLVGPWKKLNPHYRLNSYAMGKTPNQTFWRLILPLQLSPVLTAFALGIAVSIALYLPTYLLGGGQYRTLTTEVIVLSSGGNRQIVSVYGLVQAFIPFLFFALAVFLPRLLYHNKRGMDVRT